MTTTGLPTFAERLQFIGQVNELERLIARETGFAARCDEWARECRSRGQTLKMHLLKRAAIRHRNWRARFVLELRQVRHRAGEPLTFNGVNAGERE